MATHEQILSLQTTIGYTFANIDYLRQALIAAHKDEDYSDDGNRAFAQLGDAMARAVLVDKMREDGASRCATENMVQRSATRTHRATRAKALGIDVCITSSPRQNGVLTQGVLSLAFSAIIGAVWIDSEKNLQILRRVVEDLCTGVQDKNCVDPRDLVFRDPTHTEEPVSIPFPQSEISTSGSDLARCHSIDSASFGYYNDQVVLSRVASHSPMPSYHGNFSDIGNSEEIELPTTETSTPEAERSVADNPPSHVSGNEAIATSERAEYGQTILSVTPEPVIIEVKTQANCATKRKLKATDVAESSRKKRADCITLWKGYDEPLLDEFIAGEKRKYQSLGLECLVDAFLDKKWERYDTAVGLSRYRLQMRTLAIGIASIEAFEGLGTIVQASRHTPTNTNYWEAAKIKLTNKGRLEIIGSLGHNIANFALLRRWHILRLFKDNAHLSKGRYDGFIADNVQNIFTRSTSKRGNPRHNAVAEMTKAIMSEVYPTLQENSADYKERYETVTDLRRLGWRLSILEIKFGHGILGLLPFGPQFRISITDDMILSLPDEVFKRFVDELDNCAGEMLRQFSNAAASVVANICQGAQALSPAQLTEKCSTCPEALKLLVHASILPAQQPTSSMAAQDPSNLASDFEADQLIE